ncbi:insulin receptor-like [Agrilus planipennis]|uniref:Insulin receptor-like n=1 Tax=Agrilus planipennis TaxID=224129 RepID=A0A1W4X1K1_AGRPL|nr:insulin receptor-like [Agrilus planipennis]
MYVANMVQFNCKLLKLVVSIYVLSRFFVSFLVVKAKNCENVDVRVNLSNFENLRECKVIFGSLYIVLFEMSTPKDFENLTFPDLVEVKNYVIIYRVFGLTSIGKLLPNLSIIRGNTLIRDYSLVIFDLQNLKEMVDGVLPSYVVLHTPSLIRGLLTVCQGVVVTVE